MNVLFIRSARRFLGGVLVVLLALTIEWSALHAQDVSPQSPLPSVADGNTPASTRFPRQMLEDKADGTVEAATFFPYPSPALRHVVIDTDTGVDDAAALVSLFSQSRYPVRVNGIVTVSGNTTAQNAANNVLNILNKFGLTTAQVPVTIGASAPLVQPLSSTGKLLHGPDGLWFLGYSNFNPNVVTLPTNATEFYCGSDKLKNWNGATLLALGPLTNVALAIEACPQAMATFGEIVILGGAKFGGNVTPVSEYNFWQDPEAAQRVLDFVQPPYYGAPPVVATTIVPLDAFAQLTLDAKALALVATYGNKAARFIAPAMQAYIDAQTSNGVAATIPDVAAVFVMLDSKFGTKQSALVRVMTPPTYAQGTTPEPAYSLRLVRGQSIVALSLGERIAMASDDYELTAAGDQVFASLPPNLTALQTALAGILVREPDNVQFVTDINQFTVRSFALFALNQLPAQVGRQFTSSALVTSADNVADADAFPVKIYIPTLTMR